MFDAERHILLEDRNILVVNKPASLPSTGRTLDDPYCLQGMLMGLRGRMIWAAHQLDANTTGLIVFVKKKSLVPIWQERLRYPNARKRYLAVVHGDPAFEERLIEAPLGCVGGAEEPWRQGVTSDGKPATSEVRVVRRGDGVALVEVTLRTGRTHQIRVHLQHIGHPLVGETSYIAAPCALLGRHALHAWRLDFADGAAFEAPLFEDMAALLRARGLAG